MRSSCSQPSFIAPAGGVGSGSGLYHILSTDTSTANSLEQEWRESCLNHMGTAGTTKRRFSGSWVVSAALLCLALVLGGSLLTCSASEWRGSPARKIELVEPWRDVTIKLVVPSSSKGQASNSRTVEVKAKGAVYKLMGQLKPAMTPSKCSILCVHDPFTKRICFIDDNHTFYVSDPSGMRGYGVLGEVIVFSHSYLELPDRPGQEAAAVSQFENTFDLAKFRNEWNQRLTVQRIRIETAFPHKYFEDGPSPGGGWVVGAELTAFDLADDILRVDLRNHWPTPVPASIWIDLKSRSVIKSVVGGQEMDLKGAQPYLFPPKKPDPARLRQQREAEEHYQYGMALWRQNLTNQAIRELQKALILRPDHAETRKSLAAVLDAITRSPPPPGGGTNNP